MKYKIFLENMEIESFESEKLEALTRYEAIKEQFKDEDVFDTVELVEIVTVKKEVIGEVEDE